MGKRYIQHSDTCGCERCARVMDLDDSGNGRAQVWDCVEDPDILDCGCDAWRGCDCYNYDDCGDDYDED